MLLPGGLPVNGNLERTVDFRPLTGHIEQALFDANHGSPKPDRISRILAHALASVGGRPVDPGTAAALTVADRQFLMIHLAARIFGDTFWATGTCTDCDTDFDIRIERSRLPVKSAGKTYPFVSLTLDGSHIKAIVPRGKDQAEIAGLDDRRAMEKLLECCLVSVDGNPPPENFAENLSAACWKQLDEAFESVSPLVTTRLQTHCPECGSTQVMDIDPYGMDAYKADSLYEEIHCLAIHYHWSEKEILDLPREKRHLYIKLIDRATGLSS